LNLWLKQATIVNTFSPQQTKSVVHFHFTLDK